MARVQPDDYHRAAMALLAEDGPDGLTIATLCLRLGVTKGSFYHHFDGIPGFIPALLAWFEDGQRQLVAMFLTEPDVARQLQLAIEHAIALDHGAEAALRAWGRSNAQVADAMTRIDGLREDYLRGACQAAGTSAEDADFLARLAVDTLVGRQHRERPVDLAQLAAAFTRIREMVLQAAAAGISAADR